MVSKARSDAWISLSLEDLRPSEIAPTSIDITRNRGGQSDSGGLRPSTDIKEVKGCRSLVPEMLSDDRVFGTLGPPCLLKILGH